MIRLFSKIEFKWPPVSIRFKQWWNQFWNTGMLSDLIVQLVLLSIVVYGIKNLFGLVF